MSDLDELRAVIAEATAQPFEALQKHCMNEMGYSSTLFFMIFNLYKFGLERLDTVMLLLEKSKFEDCFNILRTVFETHFHLVLVTKMKRFRQTITRTLRSPPESTPEQRRKRRDSVFQKWNSDWRSKHPDYVNIVGIQKGKRNDTIEVTYQWEGLYSADDTEKKERPIAMQLFAIEDFDPEDSFVSSLPSIVEGNPWSELGSERIKGQKRIYSGFFHITALIKNLRLNELISKLQKTRVIVHYSYLSAFTHPSRKAINLGEELRRTWAGTTDAGHLILLYVAKFHELLLTSVTDFFSDVNKKSQLTVEKATEARLKTAARDLWFISDDPTDYDKFDSQTRKETVKLMSGKTVDPNLLLYYPNPLKRLAAMRLFRRNQPKEVPPWIQEFLRKSKKP